MKRLLFVMIPMMVISCTIGQSDSQIKKIIDLGDKYVSTISIDNNNSLFLTIFYDGPHDTTKWDIYSYSNGKMIKKLSGAKFGIISPNGKYFTYIVNETIFIKDNDGKILNQSPISGFIESVVWSYDSQYIYYCQQGKDNDYIFRLDIKSGKKTTVITSNRIYFHPIPATDNNVIYLLQTKYPNETDSDSNIVVYHLNNKKIETIPNQEKIFIWDSFSISPDGKLVVYEDGNTGIINIFNIKTKKIIKTIKTIMGAQPGEYCWKNDGSCLFFTMTLKEIYSIDMTKID